MEMEPDHESGTARVSLMETAPLEASMIHYRSRKSWRNFGVSSPLFPSIWGPKSGLLMRWSSKMVRRRGSVGASLAWWARQACLAAGCPGLRWSASKGSSKVSVEAPPPSCKGPISPAARTISGTFGRAPLGSVHASTSSTKKVVR